jgi:hypothetical protein
LRRRLISSAISDLLPHQSMVLRRREFLEGGGLTAVE